jgi:hypothetical protein
LSERNAALFVYSSDEHPSFDVVELLQFKKKKPPPKMNDNTLAFLEEIGRQRALIAVLEEKIALLEKELFLVKQEKGQFYGTSFQPHSADGNFERQSFQSHSADGNFERQSFQPHSADGNFERQSFQSHSADGNFERQSFQSHSAIGNNGNKTTQEPLPQKEWLRLRKEKLADLLQNQYYKRSAYTTSLHSAVLLFHLFENISLSHKHGHSMTGMTISGMAKHVLRMKRLGLIERLGFQKFAPTQAARNLIYEVMAAMPPVATV